MKKALLLTDGSVDLALALSRWLETQPEPIDLTVVYALSLSQSTDQPLKASEYRQAKQVAGEALTHWLKLLPKDASGQVRPDQSGLGGLHTETLLGHPELVLTIYLLLRRYDYLLTDGFQQDVITTYRQCQPQITTQLQYLHVSERPVYMPDRMPEVEHCLLFVRSADQLVT